MTNISYSLLRYYIRIVLSKFIDVKDSCLESDSWLIDGLNITSIYLLSSSNYWISNNKLYQFHFWLNRRIKGEPWIYILGWTLFLGRRYYVTKDTLIPRPETEILVDCALNVSELLKVPNVCDIGTGSGIVAISIFLERNNLVNATDVSMNALLVARSNAKYLNARVNFFHSNLLAALSNPIGLVVANLPYIDLIDEDNLQYEISHEPRLALYSKYQGLYIIKKLLQQALIRSAFGCVVEIGANQGLILKKYAIALGWKHVSIYQDLLGRDRVMIVH